MSYRVGDSPRSLCHHLVQAKTKQASCLGRGGWLWRVLLWLAAMEDWMIGQSPGGTRRTEGQDAAFWGLLGHCGSRCLPQKLAPNL